jgi:hypothetical protein
MLRCYLLNILEAQASSSKCTVNGRDMHIEVAVVKNALLIFVKELAGVVTSKFEQVFGIPAK